jgi:glyoxylase-like metal-dependent hydrolase (beta-lactamase superfamily II)
MQFLTEPEPPRSRPLPVGNGITRLVGPNPGLMTYWGTNTYIVQTPEGALVFDPGPDHAGHVDAILRAAGPRVAAIVLTHTHHDHVGALAALRAATGAPVAAWHAPADPAVVPDIPLQHGDGITGWVAIHTPGHAPDHLCFLGPDGVLFSGDHVMGWSTSVIGAPGGDMADYFRSLKRLLGTEAARYLPGHGPALEPAHPYVSALLAHREGREAAILAALGPAPATARDLAATLYPDVDPGLRRAAERNVTAHLQKLKGEGKAAESPEGWRAGLLAH